MAVSSRSLDREKKLRSLRRITVERIVLQDNFDRAMDLFKLNERTFAIMGVWPLQPEYLKFTVWLVYHTIHTSAVTADFVEVFGNLDEMILNFSENSWNIMIIWKMLVMRFSRTLEVLTKRVTDGIDRKFFRSPEEIEMYLAYNRVAMTFFKLWLLVGILASIAIHARPLELLFKAGGRNENVVFNLPYRTRLFFELKDASIFWLLWTYQLPLVYLNTYQAATIGYLFSLILHICGQMTVLAFRIRNLDMANHESTKAVFREIVEKHRDLLGMVDDINEVFSMLILQEVVIYTVIMGLTAYNVILNIDNTAKIVMLASVCESMVVVLMVYGYCIAGEYLVTESQNLYDSYYQCPWYEMSESFKKQLIICMMGACKPVQLMGGGFYIFSLAGFTGVVKTAAGYISMLRQVV